MNRAIVFGTGNNFIYSFKYLAEKYDVVGLADNSPDKQGESFFGYEIRRIDDYDRDCFDVVIVTPSNAAPIMEQLIELGIEKDRILPLGEALEVRAEADKLNIAVILYGGMGDFIIGKNWLYHLQKKYLLDRHHISLFCSKGDLNTIDNLFADCKWISKKAVIDYNEPSLVGDDFDLVFRFCIFPYVQSMKDEAVFGLDRILYDYADGVRKFGLENFEPGFFASPYFYKSVGRLFESYPDRKYHSHFDVLGSLEAGDEYLCEIPMPEGDEYLSELALEPKRFITLDTGLNREYDRKPNTRAWRIEDWKRLSTLLKEKYPDYKIVQIGLGGQGGSDIEADLNLSGKTNLDQVKVLLKNALLHIDYDGGLLHLRHVLKGGSSLALYGPSAAAVHNYPENIAVFSEECEPCEWTSPDWLSRCPKGCDYPKCMEMITPETVIKAVDEFFRRN